MRRMQATVFPLKTTDTRTIDSVFPLHGKDVSRTFRPDRSSEPIRSEVISHSRRFRAVSFSEDPDLYHAYAIDTLRLRPRRISSVRTIDAVRHPDFSGITERRRPLVITLPQVPELPDFSAARAAWSVLGRDFHAYGESLSAGVAGFRLGISSRQLTYAPLVGAMALGMVSAFALEHVAGSGVSAEEATIVYVDRSPSEAVSEWEPEGVSVFDTERLLTELALEDPDTAEFERRIRNMVAGYPIEEMVPEIVKQDRTVAMFLVAIAKKESNWGNRVPVDGNGQDCYNYWGYRGVRNMMGTGGHTCFNGRADAVQTVGKRLSTLINEYDLDTPEKLIVWKCGSSCDGHTSYSVQKWISDVELYYGKMNEN